MKTAAVACKEAVGTPATRLIVQKFAETISKVQAHDYPALVAALKKRIRENEFAMDADFSYVEMQFRADKAVEDSRDMLLVALTAHVAARIDGESGPALLKLLEGFQQALADKAAFAHGF